MKLRNHLFITLLTVSLVPLILCGLVMLYQNTKNVENVVKENLMVVSESQIDNIEYFFEYVKQDMEIMSNYNFLQHEVLSSLNRVSSAGEATREHLEEILKERKNYQPYIISMVITDKNLRVVAASEDENTGLGQVEPDCLTGDFVIGNVYTRRTSAGEKRAVLAYQGIYYKSELIGYIVEEIVASHFSQYHEGNTFWDNSVMQILDGKEEVVSMGGAGSTHGRFQEFFNSGKKYFTQSFELEYSDWTIRVTVNVDSYVQAEISYFALFVAVLVIGALLMMVLNYYITTRTTHPIEEIRNVLKQVQQTQDYSLRLEPGTADEMGELQHEVNRLLQCVMELQMHEKAEQKSLEKKAEKDPMTGVMNKKAIAARVEQMVEEIRTREGKIAVGFVDIDDFRDYNTKYGHAEGDHVIKYVANTLREMIPGSVGRNGGDEFVFSMETDGREIVAQTMERLMRKLENGVINGVTGEQMPIPCSIGIVIERAGKTDYRKLIQSADEAMYQAKGNGKNTYYILVK